jgi:phosphoribosylformylglycinamidine synthase subunit PurL
MKPFEILLSESQERMLVVIEKGKESEILRIFEKWDLNCAQIGEVTDTERLHFYMNGELVADVPADDLVLGGGAPVYHREYREPAYYQEYKKFRIEEVSDLKEGEITEVAKFLLSHPNICSRAWIYEQYDSMVGTANTSTNQPSDAAVVNVKGTDKHIVICVDCNGRYVMADPEIGTQIAVSEAARNVVCSGGEPVAITNNLNFGNPYLPEVYWQFVGAIKGMKTACEKFGTPVTGGNVSFYNQSNPKNAAGSVENAVFPTPTIGMLGLLEGLENRMTLHFKQADDRIYLIGKSMNCINNSEYLYSYRKIKKSPPPAFDLDYEALLQKTITALIRQNLIVSAHDCSDGGLFVALTESALPNGLGFAIQTDPNFRKDAFLFGEAQSRVVVSVSAQKEKDFEKALQSAGMDFMKLGSVTQKPDLVIDGTVILHLSEAKRLYNHTLSSYLD